MGLNHPVDLGAWQEWQRRRGGGLALIRRLRGPGDPPQAQLTTDGEAPRLLVVLDSASTSNIGALFRPVAHLPAGEVAVVAPVGLAGRLDGLGPGGATTPPGDPAALLQDLTGIRAVLASGHYLPLGAAAHRWASARDIPYVVVQHGAITPLAPPLPPGAHLLAWSQADADFWRSGRTDVTAETVGSQLLYDAADQVTPPPGAGSPVFLGQLHGAELARRDMAAIAEAFCREQGATYRPHPGESDRLSRWQHARWERRGMTIDRRGVALRPNK